MRDFDLSLFPKLVGSMFSRPVRERVHAAGRRSWSEPFGGEAIVGERLRLCRYIEEVYANVRVGFVPGCLKCIVRPMGRPRDRVVALFRRAE